MFNRP